MFHLTCPDCFHEVHIFVSQLLMSHINQQKLSLCKGMSGSKPCYCCYVSIASVRLLRSCSTTCNDDVVDCEAQLLSAVKMGQAYKHVMLASSFLMDPDMASNTIVLNYLHNLQIRHLREIELEFEREHCDIKA